MTWKRVGVLATTLLVAAAPTAAEMPVGTAFTYAGALQQGGTPVNEPVDGCAFEFSLWNDPASIDPLDQVGGTLVQTEVVIGGRLTATLDFGTDIFTGSARWLEIAVCCPAPCGSPTTLIPRQELTPAPNALRALGGVGPPGAIEVDDGTGKVGMGGAPNPAIGSILQVNGGVRSTTNVFSPEFNSVAGGSLVFKTNPTDFMTLDNAGGNLTTTGTITSGNSITIDGLADTITSSSGTISFDDEILTTTGKVGIGGPPDLGATAILQVAGGARVTDFLQINGAITSGETITVGGTAGVDGLALPDGTLQTTAAVGDGHSLDAADASPVDALLVDNDGNVGIGTTPLARLDIAASGDGAELLRLSTERPWILRQSGVGPAAHLDLHATNNNKKFFITGTDDEIIAAFDGDDGDHRVGIGTDVPATTLDARGEVTARGAVSIRNFGGSLRAQMTSSASDFGAVATRGPNGNHNFFVGAWGSNADHGWAQVSDAAGVSQAGMYVDSAGNGIVFGDTKSFRIPNPADAETEIWYASLEGPEAAAYVRGTAQLVDGRATVTFPDHFHHVGTVEGMTVHLTPLSSESRGLAVVEKALEGLVVRELSGGAGSYDFDYMVMAVRQGHEGFEVIRPALTGAAALVDAAEAAEDLSAEDAQYRTARFTDDLSAGVSGPDPVDASTLHRDLIAIRSQMEQRIASLERQLTQLNEAREVEQQAPSR